METLHYAKYGWTHTQCGILITAAITVVTRRESASCLVCKGKV